MISRPCPDMTQATAMTVILKKSRRAHAQSRIHVHTPKVSRYMDDFLHEGAGQNLPILKFNNYQFTNILNLPNLKYYNYNVCISDMVVVFLHTHAYTMYMQKNRVCRTKVSNCLSFHRTAFSFIDPTCDTRAAVLCLS